jgi:phage tail sheath protein FI
MSEYLAPGVFVEEVSFQGSQIQPASTSVAGMVGPARFGPVRGLPQLLTSFGDFQNAFGDVGDLGFSDVGTVSNYSAYAARMFFDNGGQQLYFGRIYNDVAQAGPAAARPGTASLAVPNSGTALVDFIARFPGSGGNLSLLFQPRRSPRLLQYNAPKSTDTVVLGLTNPPLSALTAANLPAGTSGIQSLTAIATLVPTSGSTPAAYDFVAGQPVIYLDQAGAPHVAPIANFATGILASAVPTTGAGAPQAVSVQAQQGIGAAPLYSIPVGTNISKLLGVPTTVSTLYGTVSGTNVILPKALNPALSADTTVPLALLGMGSRTGDGNIYHDNYDISVQRNGLTVYTFPAVSLEQDATNNLAVAMAQKPAAGSAQTTQPIYAIYNGTVSVTTLWADLFAAFDPALLNPTDRAVAPSFVLHLGGGTDGATPEPVDYAGAVDEINGSYGLASLEAIDVVSIVLCPSAAIDSTNHQAVVSAMQAHCTKMLYRVAVIDSPKGAAIADVQQFASPFSDSRLALYYPWVSVASLGPTGGNILLPPSGFVAGLYANTDITRGVYKAPANVVINDALGLEVSINTAQQEVLNPLGINCLREFTWGGFRIWGARTLSSDPQWMYVNVRRYFLYLEHSLANSTSWVVFEPNGPALWSSVVTTVTDFLYNEWREGHLLGTTPTEAFFVRCDMTTMTQADIDDGRLICVIGVAPLEPAEFVIFRIGQYTASSTSTS